MPGQKISETDRKKIDPTFICIVCELLLSSPMQTPCGHLLCYVCMETLLSSSNPTCPSDGTPLKKEEIFPDMFIKREIMGLHLHCPNEGCDWSGTNKDLQEHLANCDHALIECAYARCKKEIKRSLLARHLQQECFYRQVTCNHCKGNIGSNVLEEHVKVECPEVLLTCEHCGRTGLLRREMEQHKIVECVEIPVMCEFQHVGCVQVVKRKEFWQHLSDELQTHVRFLLTAFMNLVARVNSLQPEKLTAMLIGFMRLQGRVKSIESKMEEGGIGCNGTLLWDIDDFPVKQQNAIKGLHTIIDSPLFFTSQEGYKMRARMHVNGDGIGKGTHISLSFVVMKGKYDALLPWPFEKKITMMLLDQEGDEHVVDAFRPSLQRPTNDMNVASGFPLFMPLDGLKNRAYVKDDTMFIRILVDDGLF